MMNRWHPPIIIIFISTLAACAANSQVQSAQSIEDFAQATRGKKYMFSLDSRLPYYGEPDSLFGYKPLRSGLAQLETLCKRNSGKLVAQPWENIGNVTLPSRLTCRGDVGVLWAFIPGYSNVSSTVASNGRWTHLTLQPSLWTAAQVIERETLEAVATQELAERINAKQEKDRARISEFRQKLKPGDRFQWRGVEHGIARGMIIRMEGNMTFVQFDNMTVSGQTTRYVQRSELEPID
jgi:hypothetical protein